VNGFLASYLDTVNERLLAYLDDKGELSVDAVARMRLYTSALLAAALTPAQVMDDWADWFYLVSAFVVAYGSAELDELEYAASVLLLAEERSPVHLTDADRSYLQELELQLEMYPEMRIITEE